MTPSVLVIRWILDLSALSSTTKQSSTTPLAVIRRLQWDSAAEKDLRWSTSRTNCQNNSKFEKKYTFYRHSRRPSNAARPTPPKNKDQSLSHSTAAVNMPRSFFSPTIQCKSFSTIKWASSSAKIQYWSRPKTPTTSNNTTTPRKTGIYRLEKTTASLSLGKFSCGKTFQSREYWTLMALLIMISELTDIPIQKGRKHHFLPPLFARTGLEGDSSFVTFFPFGFLMGLPYYSSFSSYIYYSSALSATFSSSGGAISFGFFSW